MAGISKYSLWGRINWEDLYNAFLGLEERKQLLIVAGGILVLILLLVLPITCASSKLGDLEEEFNMGREGGESFTGKIATYQQDKAMLTEMKKRVEKATKGGSISTLIETYANEVGIKENIERLKPINLSTTDYYDEEGVDAVISKVNLDQITQFLLKLEGTQDLPLKISKFQIKPRYANRSELTATFQITTIKLKAEEGE